MKMYVTAAKIFISKVKIKYLYKENIFIQFHLAMLKWNALLKEKNIGFFTQKK